MKKQAIVLAFALVIGTAYATHAADTTPTPAPATIQSQVKIEPVPPAFAEQFKRAKDYEQAYVEQGKRASAWLATCDVLNEKNVFGWRKTALRRAFPPIAVAGLAPTIGWNEFKAATIMARPEGWVMTLEPRDKKLAGFEKITIVADQKDIVSVKMQ